MVFFWLRYYLTPTDSGETCKTIDSNVLVESR